VESMVPRYIPHYENSSELIWDVRLDLNWRQNFDHIFFDNILRILKCKSFVTGACGINIPTEYRELKSAIPFKRRELLKADGFYRDVLALFDNAVRQALKKVIRNYKWVLPIYFPTGRMMSLALPLFMTKSGTGVEPDLVLVCSKQGERSREYYDARTILDRDQIYQDARQICKPYCEWLFEMFRSSSPGKEIEDKLSKGASPCDENLDQGKARCPESRPIHAVGRVTRIFPKYGFIRAEEGYDVWFSVIDNGAIARALHVGDRVFFECHKNIRGYCATKLELDTDDDCCSQESSSFPAYYDVEKFRSRFVDVDEYSEQRETRW